MLLEMVASNGRTLFKLFQVRLQLLFFLLMCEMSNNRIEVILKIDNLLTSVS